MFVSLDVGSSSWSLAMSVMQSYLKLNIKISCKRGWAAEALEVGSPKIKSSSRGLFRHLIKMTTDLCDY
jgi:hypothetical protein